MRRSKIYCFLCFLNTCFQALGFTEQPQDLLTTRANTLMDDADDIQKQLNSESKAKVAFGGSNTIWIFHVPIEISTETYKQTKDIINFGKDQRQIPLSEYQNYLDQAEQDWSYKDQAKWSQLYPQCGGVSQSPVNMPIDALVHVRGARPMRFDFYDVQPTSMTVVNDWKTVYVKGEWPPGQRPIVQGGAAHNRRYIFHSLIFHWPSEHTIGGLPYPMESQAVHISADYCTLKDAINAAQRDKLAILIVANIYEFASHDQDGLTHMLKSVLSMSFIKKTVPPVPLSALSPPLKEYAAYHGSLSMPPCTEAVLWLVRARALPITRKFLKTLHSSLTIEPGQTFIRMTQHLNDRRVFYFND